MNCGYPLFYVSPTQINYQALTVAPFTCAPTEADGLVLGGQHTWKYTIKGTGLAMNGVVSNVANVVIQ